MTTLFLIPRKNKNNKYIDAVEVQDGTGHPTAILHIDTFWERGKDSQIYDRLNDGETLRVELSIVDKVE